jgi:hypothetical protein
MERSTLMTVIIACLLVAGAAWYLSYRSAPASPVPQNFPPVQSSACAPDMLSASSSWQGATGALAGSISLMDVSSSSCTVPAYPAIALESGSSTLPLSFVRQGTTTDAAPLSLAPSASAQALFSWRNWCAAAPKGPMRFVLMLQGGSLSIPVVSASGQPVRPGAPRCDDKTSSSTLSLQAFSI